VKNAVYGVVVFVYAGTGATDNDADADDAWMANTARTAAMAAHKRTIDLIGTTPSMSCRPDPRRGRRVCTRMTTVRCGDPTTGP